MDRLGQFCMKVKLVAVELTSLVAFLGILVVGAYLEWHHLAEFLRK
jgi:hypothetical protein